MVDNILEDVLITILTRLLVEAIVRFTLVCKSWFSLITNPNFISCHLNQTIPNNNGHLLVGYCTAKEHFYSLQFDSNNTFHEYKKFDFSFTCLGPHFSIVSSCNGLICIFDDQLRYNFGMYLWNPCIRKTVEIPNPNIIFASHFRHSLGFGFDSVANDFKVVRILHLGLGHDPDLEVYTLKSGCWRNISFGKAMPYVVGESSKQVYVNGVAHWIAYDLSGDNYSMVSFDMSDEVMPVPNLIARRDLDKEMHLLPFRESISLIEYWSVWDRDFHCLIWVMKEYGVAESWSKLCGIDLTEHLMKPLGLKINSEVILATIRWNLVSYDPESIRITDLEIHERRRDMYWDSFYVGTHKESLVLLDK